MRGCCMPGGDGAAGPGPKLAGDADEVGGRVAPAWGGESCCERFAFA